MIRTTTTAEPRDPQAPSTLPNTPSQRLDSSPRGHNERCRVERRPTSTVSVEPGGRSSAPRWLRFLTVGVVTTAITIGPDAQLFDRLSLAAQGFETVAFAQSFTRWRSSATSADSASPTPPAAAASSRTVTAGAPNGFAQAIERLLREARQAADAGQLDIARDRAQRAHKLTEASRTALGPDAARLSQECAALLAELQPQRPLPPSTRPPLAAKSPASAKAPAAPTATSPVFATSVTSPSAGLLDTRSAERPSPSALSSSPAALSHAAPASASPVTAAATAAEPVMDWRIGERMAFADRSTEVHADSNPPRGTAPETATRRSLSSSIRPSSPARSAAARIAAAEPDRHAWEDSQHSPAETETRSVAKTATPTSIRRSTPVVAVRSRADWSPTDNDQLPSPAANDVADDVVAKTAPALPDESPTHSALRLGRGDAWLPVPSAGPTARLPSEAAARGARQSDLDGWDPPGTVRVTRQANNAVLAARTTDSTSQETGTPAAGHARLDTVTVTLSEAIVGVDETNEAPVSTAFPHHPAKTHAAVRSENSVQTISFSNSTAPLATARLESIGPAATDVTTAAAVVTRDVAAGERSVRPPSTTANQPLSLATMPTAAASPVSELGLPEGSSAPTVSYRQATPTELVEDNRRQAEVPTDFAEDVARRYDVPVEIVLAILAAAGVVCLLLSAVLIRSALRQR